MAAFFIDIDGTIVNYHTSEWLPLAKEKLITLNSQGHQIYFITMRGPQDEGTQWSVENTHKLLSELSFGYNLITGVHSPRFLIDDNSIGAINTPTNSGDWIGRV